MPDRELRSVGRYEWEQILKRARLDGVIAGSGRVGKSGKQTRGGMTGTTFKAIALGWASWGSDRGQEIWPGDATVAIALETTIDRVATVRRKLVDLGLLEFVRARHGRRGDEYRLTLPSDLLDLVDVLTPAQMTLAAGRLRDEARGKHRSGSRPQPPTPGGPADHPNDSNAGGPAEDPQPVDNSALGGPADTPAATRVGGPADPQKSDVGGPADPRVGGPAEARTDQDRTSTTTDHSDTALRTAVTLVGHPQAAQDPLFPVVDEVPEPEPNAPSRCERHPLAGGLRDDGQSRCALCRVDARKAANGTAGTGPPTFPNVEAYQAHLRLIRDEVA